MTDEAGPFQHLALGFFLTGAVDDSRFVVEPIDFTPAESFGDVARRLLLWGVGILAVGLLFSAVAIWLVVRRWRRRRRARQGRGEAAEAGLG